MSTEIIGAPALTESVALLAVTPPGPAQVSVYEYDPGVVCETTRLPDVGCDPVHAPLALQLVASAEADHVSVELWPASIEAGVAEIVSVGGSTVGAEPELPVELPPPHADSTAPATSADATHKRRPQAPAAKMNVINFPLVVLASAVGRSFCPNVVAGKGRSKRTDSDSPGTRSGKQGMKAALHSRRRPGFKVLEVRSRC